jgi:hypothetical protein
MVAGISLDFTERRNLQLLHVASFPSSGTESLLQMGAVAPLTLLSARTSRSGVIPVRQFIQKQIFERVHFVSLLCFPVCLLVMHRDVGLLL